MELCIILKQTLWSLSSF